MRRTDILMFEFLIGNSEGLPILGFNAGKCGESYLAVVSKRILAEMKEEKMPEQKSRSGMSQHYLLIKMRSEAATVAVSETEPSKLTEMSALKDNASDTARSSNSRAFVDWFTTALLVQGLVPPWISGESRVFLPLAIGIDRFGASASFFRSISAENKESGDCNTRFWNSGRNREDKADFKSCQTNFKMKRSRIFVPAMEKDTGSSMLTIRSALKDKAFGKVGIIVSRRIRVSTTHLLMSLRLTPNPDKWCLPQFLHPQTNGGVRSGDSAPVVRSNPLTHSESRYPTRLSVTDKTSFSSEPQSEQSEFQSLKSFLHPELQRRSAYV